MQENNKNTPLKSSKDGYLKFLYGLDFQKHSDAERLSREFRTRTIVSINLTMGLLIILNPIATNQRTTMH